MAKWIKNLTTVAEVTVEVQVRCLAQCSVLKDPVRIQSLALEFPYVAGVTTKNKQINQ